MKTSLFYLLLAIPVLCSCSSDKSQIPQAIPGADRDSHGCIGSAGYSWCAKTNQCERPWELAEKKSFDNTKESFENFCQTPTSGS